MVHDSRYNHRDRRHSYLSCRQRWISNHQIRFSEKENEINHRLWRRSNPFLSSTRLLLENELFIETGPSTEKNGD